MSSRIHLSLTKQFEKHRLIFWYDNNQEFQDAFDELELDGVEKVKILNNESTARQWQIYILRR